MSVPVPHLVPLAVGLAAAVGFDLVRRRIPNLISAFVLVSGLVVRAVDDGALGALTGAASAVALIVVLYRPWQAGGIGGGDVKLAAATACWISLNQLVWFALSGALAGGGVAIVCYLLARAPARAEVRANVTLAVFHHELPPVPSHRQGHMSVPYALAIAAGAAFALIKG